MTLTRLKEVLGSRIRSLRIAKSWTQARLAGEIEVDPAYISSIESSKKIPSPKILCNIADVFGIEVYELFMDDEDFKKAKYKNRKIFDFLKDSSPGKVKTFYKIARALYSEQS